MKMKNVQTRIAVLLLSTLCFLTSAHAQLTPSSDSYTNTAATTTNYGANTLLDVQSSQTAYIQFDLSAIPSGYTGANIAKASLKLYVNAVTTAGSFNVDYVNGSWSESTINASNAPALGTTIAASVPLTTTEKNKYIVIDITPAVQAWLNGTANDGIALVGNSPVNANFDSKESTTTSHSPELDIVFASGSGGGITGITTASGSGLKGGGTKGTLNLSLTNACAANQVLEWNGTAWICASLTGNGTITGVTAGTDLTGGGTSGTVKLNVDTTKVPQLAAANTFTANQTVKGNLTATGTVSAADGTLSDVLTITSASANPLYVATSSSVRTTAIYGVATSTTGTAFGVEGVTASSGPGAYGVVGNAIATSGTPYGVYGLAANSPGGVGVFGQAGSISSTGADQGSAAVGLWGDAGVGGINSGSIAAVMGTADNSYAGYFENNGGFYSVEARNESSEGGPFVAYNAANNTRCDVDNNGNLSCTGTKNALVPIDGGKRTVAMSAIESPQNWFEDFGSAQLVNGVAVVTLDPDFIQTVNTGTNYKVFPVPNGNCKGLYVTNKTAGSFEVRELGEGTSNVSFDYRITALRRNYENVRFADHTHDMEATKLTRHRAQTAPTRTQADK